MFKSLVDDILKEEREISALEIKDLQERIAEELGFPFSFSEEILKKYCALREKKAMSTMKAALKQALTGRIV